jgi:aminomethyltransferase
MFEGLWEAGRADGMRLCGSQALNLRRMEAAIVNVGQDFDWRHNPFEVGLGWMVDLGKPSFVGREALARVKRAGVARRLIGATFAGEAPPAQGDTVRLGPKAVGRVTGAVRSPALGACIGMAFVDAEAAEPGTRLTVAAAGGAIDAEVVRTPFLDPERRLARA